MGSEMCIRDSACLQESEWEKFCEVVDRKDLSGDPRFASAARKSHDDELISQLSGVFATRTALEWEELLSSQDVPCVRVVDNNEEESSKRKVENDG